MAGAAPAPVPVKPVVPWTVELVRPLVSQTATLLETLDGESLERAAEQLSAKCAAFVRANCHWHPVAKNAVVEGGAECLVKYLNLANVSAEYAPEIKFALGVIAIVHARSTLLTELRKMHAEDLAAKNVKREAA